MKTKFLAWAAIMATILVCSGCAMFSKATPEKSASELVQEGIEAYEKGRYAKALSAFEQLKNWFPFSQYAILAELKIADAHYHLRQYPEAVAAYEEFERLHPRNEAIPYVIYQIGRCYFEQIDSIDRDQTSAQKAHDTFMRLKRQYPDDPHARKASAHLVICLQSLAGHEFYVGQFYFQQQRFAAALHRFHAVIDQYPDVGYHYEALRRIAECEAFQTLESQTHR